MSDLQRPVNVGADPLSALYEQMKLSAAVACSPWAHAEISPELDILLWPRARGRDGAPYRVTDRVILTGVSRLTLCAQGNLPPGATLAARDAVVCAQIALTMAGLHSRVLDQVVQLGLFAEVIYR